MSALRLVVALALVVLYVVVVVQAMLSGTFELAAIVTPVATLGLTYILGKEMINVTVNRRRNGPEA